MVCFNTQPPEGGWTSDSYLIYHILVSTHSRPKAAGNSRIVPYIHYISFNTQPPEGGWLVEDSEKAQGLLVSTHSRPKAAGALRPMKQLSLGFQHTAARRRLAKDIVIPFEVLQFQHTAARRRLARHLRNQYDIYPCFNTQPPEGGWSSLYSSIKSTLGVSTHSRPKAAGLLEPAPQSPC